MPSSIYCTTAALWIAINTLTTFTLHVHWYQTLLWFNITQIFNWLTSANFLAIFNKYLRVLKIWGTFPFFFPEFSWNLKLKTCHLLHFMHWHVHKSVRRFNVLTGVKWLPRGFRWHALTSMQNRASQLSMFWGQCDNPANEGKSTVPLFTRWHGDGWRATTLMEYVLLVNKIN